MREVMSALGMSDEQIEKLSYDLWSAKVARQRGIAPRPHIAKQPLPAGAKPIGQWIAENIADENFNDLLEALADMSDALRNSYYWTPDPGPSGDMNRRFIWVIGPKDDPMGWAALTIDDDEAEPLLSDPNIFLFNDEDDQ
ncbi:MAG: hypothetical protein DI606_16335 [Sphingobium sp.]|nr:MAG: hypothetical protein DI606_16335 [Sphingobium sp.]